LNNIVVSVAEDFTPETNLAAFVVSCKGFKDFCEVDVIGFAQGNSALFECMILIHEVGSLIKFSAVQGLYLGLKSLHILYIIALNVWLIHFAVELMVFHELVEVELVGTEVIRKDFEIGHAIEFGLVGDLLANEVGEVVDDAGVGKFTSGKFVEENVGH
jgi:hypothetical protein